MSCVLHSWNCQKIPTLLCLITQVSATVATRYHQLPHHISRHSVTTVFECWRFRSSEPSQQFRQWHGARW